MAASRRERKVVTVLFCDLVGFTARAESLDPEDVEALLGPYHARVRAELERHGGTVEKFIGDAVMALFGAPVAHEDDPERAVRAALAIHDFALEEGLELRIGVTTGEALVRLDAQPDSGEGMASGDVVNTAARLQAAAPVNGILVNEATHRATRDAVEYEDAPAVEAKGKSEPVAVWRAVAARSRFGVDVSHHARAELVGREREVAILAEAFERARQERVPQLVTLVGVPGIGKSRLVYELSRIADAAPDLITWRQGRCLAYGDGVAFWALAEMVKAQAGIDERDSEADAVAKLRAAIEAAIPEEGDARWIETHLRPLIGVETEGGLGDDRRGEAFAAWRRLLEALAEQRMLVLVFEDLHWADDGLLDFVDELVDWLRDVPLLVVASARPELLERRPGWGGGKLNASTIGLAPLSSEQTSLLIAHVLERAVLPAATQGALLERAEGNPLYAEQFAQLYLERGSASELPLPETLQGIVAARLDGLAADEKAALQDAAVIGKVFWAGGLGLDADRTSALLHSLERKGFLTRQRRSSVEGESEWSFSHMLLRDVAYSQIPRAERAAKHRAAAEWIESLARPEDYAELLAHHWRSALELAEASGQGTAELVDPARRALREAGTRALSVNAYATAVAYYEGALALWPEEDAERPQLLYRWADALGIADDDGALEALETARDALLKAGDEQTAAEAELSMARLWWRRGQREESFRHDERAAELAGSATSRAAARVLAYRARTRMIAGDPAEGIRLGEQALAMAEALGNDEIRAHALSTVGSSKGYLGNPGGGADMERALEIAVAARSPQAGTILNNLAVQALWELDMPRAAELIDEGLRVAELYGAASEARWLRGQQAGMAYFLGRWDEALEFGERFIAECEAGSPHYLYHRALAERAEIRRARGDFEGALPDLRRSLALAREAGDPQALHPRLGSTILIFEEHGLADEARPLAVELVDLVPGSAHEAALSLCFAFLISRLALGFEPVLRRDLAGAPPGPWKELAFACLDRDFVRGADIWAAGGSPAFEARVRLRAAEELVESGRHAEGEEQARRALEFYRSVAATYFVDRCETLLKPYSSSQATLT
jgi:class 3 adenylate cyclase/tetratricopeptide (TPR) repeat protein